MLTNEIWLRKTIVFTNRVLLIHRKRSPFPAGEGIVKPQFISLLCKLGLKIMNIAKIPKIMQIAQKTSCLICDNFAKTNC